MDSESLIVAAPEFISVMPKSHLSRSVGSRDDSKNDGSRWRQLCENVIVHLTFKKLCVSMASLPDTTKLRRTQSAKGERLFPRCRPKGEAVAVTVWREDAGDSGGRGKKRGCHLRPKSKITIGGNQPGVTTAAKITAQSRGRATALSR
jgi:hypothetical protein